METNLSDPCTIATGTCGACCTRIQNVNVFLEGRQILDSIHLHIHCGQLAVIIGPNGGGKTTLLKTMLGEIKPLSGSIQFTPAATRNHREFKIGYVPQKLEYDASTPLSVLDLFAMTLSRKPLWLGIHSALRHRAHEALASVKAEKLLDAHFGSLSGGELQRVLLALALCPVPDLLLLDEPVSGVDPAGIELFYKMVSDLRRHLHLAIVMVSHDIGTVSSFADRMLFLNRKIICDDIPSAVLADGEVQRTFGRFSTVS